MKNYSLIVALLILLVASVSLAETQPVPDENTDKSSVEVEVKAVQLTHYSPLIAAFGNIIPGLGYFLIDEPGWAWTELGLMGIAGTIGSIGFTMLYSSDSHDGYLPIISSMVLAGATYIGGLIHAPFLALHKYEQQKVALDLSPGIGLDSEGEAYPTVQLTLSF